MNDQKLVIFDKDGTLIDVHYYWCGMIKLRADMLSKKYVEHAQQEKVANELMSEMGINLDTQKMKSAGPVGIKPREFIIDVAHQVVKKHHRLITVEQVSSVFKVIDEYSKQHLNELVKPLIGVEKLLIKLKKSDYKITIATTDLTARAELAMQSIDLLKYFDYIAGGDAVMNAKPHPDLVHYLCKKMNVHNTHTTIIGDSIVDLDMAGAANVAFIGVKTGLHCPQFLQQGKVIVDDLTYVGELL